MCKTHDKKYYCFLGICLACGDDKVRAEHPLFEGGLCKECKVLKNWFLNI